MPEAVGVQIKNLNKSFKDYQVITDLDLEIAPGSFTCLVGPSGCGKSTILRLIAGLETPTSGLVQSFSTDGQSTSENKSHSPANAAKNSTDNRAGNSAANHANSYRPAAFSFVFQDANLLPWRNVFENVTLPFELDPQLKNTSAKEIKSRAQEVLKKVGLEKNATLFPHELSGGMKMRVSLARALINKPRLLLMDEPFAALDEITRFEMQNQLFELWRQEKMTVIFVTHSLFEAAYISERIIMLRGPGAKIILDKKLSLPTIRNEELRTSAQFNDIVKEISERLRV